MIILAMSMLLLAAQDPSSAASDAGVKPKKPHLICKADAETGSMIAKRTCHTAEEWHAIEQQADSHATPDGLSALSRRNGRF
jgi:hypothetical protein